MIDVSLKFHAFKEKLTNDMYYVSRLMISKNALIHSAEVGSGTIHSQVGNVIWAVKDILHE